MYINLFELKCIPVTDTVSYSEKDMNLQIYLYLHKQSPGNIFLVTSVKLSKNQVHRFSIQMLEKSKSLATTAKVGLVTNVF